MSGRLTLSLHVAETLNPGTLRLTAMVGPHSASFADVFDGFLSDSIWRLTFNRVLAERPFAAFRWECPGLTREEATRSFECVVLNAPELDRPANAAAFEERFQDANAEGVVSFPNLSGDARLIVPAPSAESDAYAHLAAFLRSASAEQCEGLWKRVGEEIHHRTDDRPVWLNTAGAGVPWLHIRLDDRPKYYRHRPYRQPPQ
ncbi:MAG: hypothetical protein AAF907_05320 [Planctomycetota bacterium]